MPNVSTNFTSDQNKDSFRDIIRTAIERGYIQMATDGSPFTLIVAGGAVELLEAYDLRMSPLDKPVIGKVEGQKKPLTHVIDWEDRDKNNKADKGNIRGLMSFFDNNMDEVMKAIQGIRVVPPSTVVCDVTSGGKSANYSPHVRERFA